MPARGDKRAPCGCGPGADADGLCCSWPYFFLKLFSYVSDDVVHFFSSSYEQQSGGGREDCALMQRYFLNRGSNMESLHRVGGECDESISRSTDAAEVLKQ